MPNPMSFGETFIFSGSTGNPLIDAMLAPAEMLRVPVSQRSTTIGETQVIWGGGPPGSGVTLTYSFVTAASSFVPNYPSPRSDATLPSGRVEVSENLKEIFRAAFQEWANVANVRFVEVLETASDVGEIRIGVTTTGSSGGG